MEDGQLTAENKGFMGISKTKKATELSLANWVDPNAGKNNPWKHLSNATAENFVDFYKTKVGSVFNVDKNDSLNLGTFEISLNYLNIFGLGLSGNVKDKNNEDLSIALNLSGDGIDKKLTNWGKIIVQFLKYSGSGIITADDSIGLEAPIQDFKKITMKNQKDGLKGAIKIMFDSFKDSDEAKSLEDIDLFSLMTNSLLTSQKDMDY
ncbi:hypothetical protein [Spiroplasma endosymbiont of Sarcophaga carnaria]|uniref:hypothetical protein n=1 Tax=Spiroplasma endosymbiont of Sarcophaga carnaria TaxID=3066303 RepID=UPI0030D48555